jgi:protein involved in plasmid replication-relaxation
VSTLFRSASERAHLATLDVGLLSLGDRACLRLLYRCEAATGLQVATLVYPSRRTALRHLRRLWQLGLVERTPLPPNRGGMAVAYRLSLRGAQRLGYSSRRLGGLAHLRHALDTVDVVCTLSRGGHLQAWLTPLMTDDLFDGSLRPDAVLILQANAGSAVVCLEVDEATEHAPQIQGKLTAYERMLPHRPGWHLLFSVPTRDRLTWLRRVAGWDEHPGLAHRSWAVTLLELTAGFMETTVTPVGWDDDEHLRLGDIVADPRPRRSTAPVGTTGWVRLLGSGGAEDVDEALAW